MTHFTAREWQPIIKHNKYDLEMYTIGQQIAILDVKFYDNYFPINQSKFL